MRNFVLGEVSSLSLRRLMVRRYDGDLKAQMPEDMQGLMPTFPGRLRQFVRRREGFEDFLSFCICPVCYCFHQDLAQSLSQSLGHSFARSDRRFPGLVSAVYRFAALLCTERSRLSDDLSQQPWHGFSLGPFQLTLSFRHDHQKHALRREGASDASSARTERRLF